MKPVANALGIARSNLSRRLAETSEERRAYVKVADGPLLEEIASIVDAAATATGESPPL